MYEHSSQFRYLKKDNLVHLLLVFVHVANVGTPDPAFRSIFPYFSIRIAQSHKEVSSQHFLRVKIQGGLNPSVMRKRAFSRINNALSRPCFIGKRHFVPFRPMKFQPKQHQKFQLSGGNKNQAWIKISGSLLTQCNVLLSDVIQSTYFASPVDNISYLQQFQHSSSSCVFGGIHFDVRVINNSNLPPMLKAIFHWLKRITICANLLGYEGTNLPHSHTKVQSNPKRRTWITPISKLEAFFLAHPVLIKKS